MRRNTDDNLNSYKRFSKSMSMIPETNIKPSNTIQNDSYYTGKINSTQNLSPRKTNNYLTDNKSTLVSTRNRDELYNSPNKSKNGYFDSMNN